MRQTKFLTTQQQQHRAKKNRERRERRVLNRDKRDPRLIDLEARVRALKRDINLETVYALLLSGHSVYKQGIGLPHDCIRETIFMALSDGDTAFEALTIARGEE